MCRRNKPQGKEIPGIREKLRHIAFIMDGNGRWARRRGLPREAGHAEGARNLRKILTACRDRGIRVVTVYAFSTENWKRPKKEVDAIMDLLSRYVDEAYRDRDKNQMCIRCIGDLTALTDGLRERIDTLARETECYAEKNILEIALNYGSREELVHAFNTLAARGVTKVTEEDIAGALYTAGVPDPDLVVRTSGETRISNFLLYQSAYTEYAFTKTPWPALTEKELDRIIRDFLGRKRRYGGL